MWQQLLLMATLLLAPCPGRRLTPLQILLNTCLLFIFSQQFFFTSFTNQFGRLNLLFWGALTDINSIKEKQGDFLITIYTSNLRIGKSEGRFHSPSFNQ